jgi:hypothetical protein
MPFRAGEQRERGAPAGLESTLLLVPTERHVEGELGRRPAGGGPFAVRTFRSFVEEAASLLSPELSPATAQATRLAARAVLDALPPGMLRRPEEPAARAALADAIDRSVGRLRRAHLEALGEPEAELLGAVLARVDALLEEARLFDPRGAGALLARRLRETSAALPGGATTAGVLALEADDLAAIEAIHAGMRARGGSGVRMVLPRTGSAEDAIAEIADGLERRWASLSGFNVNAAVRVGADMDEARERLVRYCARPAIALDRISRLPDGRIAYRMKYPRRGTTHRVMTPMDFMARICALIPPPFYPLARYYGVLAPHAKLRPLIVPRPRSRGACPTEAKQAEAPKGEERRVRKKRAPGRLDARQGRGNKPVGRSAATGPRDEGARATAGVAPCSALSGSASATTAAAPDGLELGANIITIQHWDRLLGGQLLATAPRIPWATLLRRVHAVDVLTCARCQGRLRLLGAITDPAAVRKVLLHLGMAVEPKAVSPPRGWELELDPGWGDG